MDSKPSLGSRFKQAWNAFFNKDPTDEYAYRDFGVSSSVRPDRPRFTRGNEKSIITAIYNRIGLDCAAISIRHCRLDDNKRFVEEIDSDLNNCLSLEANIDQTGRALMQDIVMSMLDDGSVAVIPIETSADPRKTDSYKIYELRTGKILEWYPEHVKVRVYNERTGDRQEITLPKKIVSIIENPFYAVVNEHNSTANRLARKLAILDAVDEQNGSGKLNIIIQLPYVIKSNARLQQAEKRRRDIEEQLGESKYGIAYTDGTEKITQLNRPLETNLMNQIEYLTSMLYSQLGITKEILDGTADEQTTINYYNNTIEPIMSAIANEMKRKFLTKTARSQHQSIEFFRDPFRLIPVSKISEIADKFTRNEIMSSNEVRQIVGMKPSSDPNADELRNKNLNQKVDTRLPEQPSEGDNNQNEEEYV